MGSGEDFSGNVKEKGFTAFLHFVLLPFLRDPRPLEPKKELI